MLVDAQMLVDSQKFTMDLVPALKRTLHASEVKILITNCTVRHIYDLPTTNHSLSVPPSLSSASTTPQTSISPATKTALINLAKTFYLRKCDHHKLPEPLVTLACYKDVMDPKGSGARRASPRMGSWSQGSATGLCKEECELRHIEQQGEISLTHQIQVMIMEPMAQASVDWKDGGERAKLRGGLVRKKKGEAAGKKRKREDEAGEGNGEANDTGVGDEGIMEIKKKKPKVKGPNPLSVKKKKKVGNRGGGRQEEDLDVTKGVLNGDNVSGEADGAKRKRRRKHKSATRTGEALEATEVGRRDTEEVDGG